MKVVMGEQQGHDAHGDPAHRVGGEHRQTCRHPVNYHAT
jgi:hypothetical protein